MRQRLLTDVERKVRARGAISAVVIEYERQEVTYGERNHNPLTYLAVIVEATGRLARASLRARYGGPDISNMRMEAVQIAAAALGFITCLDRKKWSWKSYE